MVRLIAGIPALLFFCAAITLTVVHGETQQLACPDGKIYGYVNETGTGRDLYVEVFANDLQDCIHRCFGNEFCYSLSYDQRRNSAPCHLYYYSAYNCSFRELVLAKDITYSGGSITVDCLRCPALGEFRTGNKGDFVVDENGGEDATKPAGVANFSEVPVIEATTASGTNASETSGEETSSAGPGAEGNDTIVEETTASVPSDITATTGAPDGLNGPPDTWNNGTGPGNGTEPSIDETTGSTLTAEGAGGNGTTTGNGTESAEGTGEETTGASVTAEGSIDATPQGFTKVPAGPRPPCDGEVHFRPLARFADENVRQPVFQNHTTAHSASECARLCYELGCHLALFNPQPLDGVSAEPTCQFAFESEENIGLTEKTGCGEEEDKTADEHSSTAPVTLACIQCVHAGEGATETPTSGEPAVGEPENVTGSAGSGAKNTCAGDVYFLQSEQLDVTSRQFANTVLNASSSAECARQCYESGCEIAHFIPESGTCMLTAPGATGIVRDCVLVHPSAFVKDHDAKQPVDISCPHCGQPVDLATGTESPSGNVTVESAIDVGPSSETIDQRPGEGAHESCSITFQVDTERKTADIEFRDIARVQSIDQCAYICYRDSCSLAVFDPPTAPEGKGYCKTQFKDGEVCSPTLPRVYQYPTEKSIAIQCIRCSLEGTGATEAPSAEGSTGWRAVTENSTAVPSEVVVSSNETNAEQPSFVTESSVGSNETVSSEPLVSTEAPSESSANGTSGSSESGGAEKMCKITFQAVDGFAHSIDETVRSENDTSGLTSAECARKCFVEKCVRAAHDPQSGLCLLSFPTESETCLDLERVSVLANEKQTWLQCIECEPIEEKDVASVPAGVQVISQSAHDAEQLGNATETTGAESNDETAITESTGSNFTAGPEVNETATVVALPAEEGNVTVVVQPSEEGNGTTEVTVNEGVPAGNETVVVQPSEEGNGTTEVTVNEGNLTGNETVVVQPNVEGNGTTEVTVTEGIPAGNETVVVQPSEEGNATTEVTVNEGVPAGNETVIVQPNVEGNGTTEVTVNEGTPAGNETVVVQPNVEGNGTTEVTVNEGNLNGNETVVVQPSEEGNGTTEVTVNEGVPAGNETVVVQPNEEGNATTEVTVNEGVPAGNETVVVQPNVEGNGTTEVTVNEGVPAGNETVVIQPSEEGNGTTEVTVTEGIPAGNETVVVQPSEEGNATTEVTVNEGVPAGNETVIVQPNEEGNATTEVTVNEGEQATGNETVVVQPNQEGNTSTIVTVNGGESADNGTVVIQPSEGANVTTEVKVDEGSATITVTGNDTVIVQPSEGANVTTEVKVDEGTPATGNETVAVQPATEVEPTQEPAGGNETVTEAPTEEGNVTIAVVEGGLITEAPGNETASSEVETSTEAGATNSSESASPTETLPAGPVGLGNGCVVTFEFDPIAKKPEEVEDGEGSTTSVTSAAICARRCYQDGCTGASYDPSSGACILNYGDYDSCTATETTSIFKGTEAIWIRCARCQTNLPQVEEGAEVIGQADQSASEGAAATESTPQSGAESTTEQSSSSAPEATGEEVTVGESFNGESNATTEAAPGGVVVVSNAEGNETNAEGEPNAVTAVVIDETQLSNGSVVTSAPIAIAPSEDNATLTGGETVEISTNAPSSNESSVVVVGGGDGDLAFVTSGTENITIAPQSEGDLAFVTSGTENITIAPQSEGEAVTFQPGSAEETSQATNETVISGAIDATPSNVNKEDEAVSLAPAQAGEGETAANATESSTGTSSDELTPHGCVVSFEVAEPSAALTSMNSSEEQSAGDCARRCFLTGCTVAGWEPDLNVCSYYFGEPIACANSRNYYNFVAERPVWLQCLKCGALL
uniref:Apple domain-containing protein n=1 Tax=Plectus sambesii TaxID=2011161 RepID=A0A914V2P7_9BILA